MRTTVQNINREVTKVGRINGFKWEFETVTAQKPF